MVKDPQSRTGTNAACKVASIQCIALFELKVYVRFFFKWNLLKPKIACRFLHVSYNECVALRGPVPKCLHTSVVLIYTSFY